MGLIKFGVMNRIIPNRLQYPDPKDPAAKKPKSCEVVPMQHMAVSHTGLYIFTVEGVGKMKTQMWLFLAVFLAFFFLLFRVWPEWLKLGVWYISWYTLVFLVSLNPFCPFRVMPNFAVQTRQNLDYHSYFACYCLVHYFPHRNRLLDLP